MTFRRIVESIAAASLINLPPITPVLVQNEDSAQSHDHSGPTASDRDGHAAHSDAEQSPAHGASYRLGDLTVQTPWSRATPPRANVAGGYMTIRNEGDTPGKLTGALSLAAGRVEIHTMSASNIPIDDFKLTRVPGEIQIPP